MPSDELFLVVQHKITTTRTVSLKAFRVPGNVTAGDMKTVIDLFKEEELERPLEDVDQHSFSYHLETSEDRGGSGGMAWPLDD